MRNRALVAAWVSLAVSVVHGIGVWLAFGGTTPRIPIADPFVRWELLNIEACFTTLLAATSVLAIRATTAAPLLALAVLWTVDAVFMVAWPMPVPAKVGWVVVLATALLGLLAFACWSGARSAASRLPA